MARKSTVLSGIDARSVCQRSTPEIDASAIACGQALSVPLPTIGTTRFDESFGSISPNGQWIAYESDSTGLYEIYLIASSGQGTPLQISTDGGLDPKWSPDGAVLYYRRGRAIMEAAVTDGQPAGLPSVLIDRPDLVRGASYDILADGSRIIALQQDADAIPREIRIVTSAWHPRLFPLLKIGLGKLAFRALAVLKHRRQLLAVATVPAADAG